MKLSDNKKSPKYTPKQKNKISNWLIKPGENGRKHLSNSSNIQDVSVTTQKHVRVPRPPSSSPSLVNKLSVPHQTFKLSTLEIHHIENELHKENDSSNRVTPVKDRGKDVNIKPKKKTKRKILTDIERDQNVSECEEEATATSHDARDKLCVTPIKQKNKTTTELQRSPRLHNGLSISCLTSEPSYERKSKKFGKKKPNSHKRERKVETTPVKQKNMSNTKVRRSPRHHKESLVSHFTFKPSCESKFTELNSNESIPHKNEKQLERTPVKQKNTTNTDLRRSPRHHKELPVSSTFNGSLDRKSQKFDSKESKKQSKSKNLISVISSNKKCTGKVESKQLETSKSLPIFVSRKLFTESCVSQSNMLNKYFSKNEINQHHQKLESPSLRSPREKDKLPSNRQNHKCESDETEIHSKKRKLETVRRSNSETNIADEKRKKTDKKLELESKKHKDAEKDKGRDTINRKKRKLEAKESIDNMYEGSHNKCIAEEESGKEKKERELKKGRSKYTCDKVSTDGGKGEDIERSNNNVRNNKKPSKKKSKGKNKNIIRHEKHMQENLDNYIKRSLKEGGYSKIIKFSRSDSSESCEFPSFKTTNKKSKEQNNDTFKKYGVILPSIDEILAEQEELEKYKNQLEAFEDMEHKNFELPPSLSDLHNHSELNCSDVLGCKHLTPDVITEEFKKNFGYISDIFYGKRYSDRHNRFFENQNKNYTYTIKDLTYSTSAIVFNDEQKELMISLLKENFDPEDKWTLYFFQVLLPELCLKVFMDTHNMTYEEAVKYLDSRPIIDD